MTEKQKSRLREPYISSKVTIGPGLGMMIDYRIDETLQNLIALRNT